MAVPNILFIHGAAGSKNKWREVKHYLQQAEYSAIDLSAHGDNKDKVLTSIEAHAEYLNETIVEDTIIVGHSMGGLIALELAGKNNHVKGIVLAASFYELPVHSKVLEKLKSGEFPKSLFYASYHEPDEELLKVEENELAQIKEEIAYADFNACNDYTVGFDRLSKLNIPIFAIIGKQDKLLPKDAKEKLEKLNVKVVEVDEAGHYLILEKPKEFLTELKQLINTYE